MFHCQIDGNYIVLFESEAQRVYMDATGSAAGAITYNMRDLGGGRSRIKRNTRIIIEHLRQEYFRDAETFRRKYIFRSAWERDCLPTLFALMDGYRRIIQRADIAEMYEYDAELFFGKLAKPPDYLTFLIMERCGLCGRQRRTIATHEIFTSHLQHVFGSTDNFVVLTRTQKLKFTEDGIRVSPEAIAYDLEDEDDETPSVEDQVCHELRNIMRDVE